MMKFCMASIKQNHRYERLSYNYIRQGDHENLRANIVA